MGVAEMSNLLMSATREQAGRVTPRQRRLLKLLIDHVSALEYATECATSEASNTIFTAQASSAAPQALQAATTAVQPREALLAAMAYGKELEPQHRQRPDARPPASERELKQTEATASAGTDTAGAYAARARERLGSLAASEL